MIPIAYHIFLILVAAAVALSLYRLIRGPSVADRLNAADVIALSFVALAVAHGWKENNGLWLDLAMVAGLVLFVGTTAVSVFTDREDLNSPES